jgi:hypothetical protein
MWTAAGLSYTEGEDIKAMQMQKMYNFKEQLGVQPFSAPSCGPFPFASLAPNRIYTCY